MLAHKNPAMRVMAREILGSNAPFPAVANDRSMMLPLNNSVDGLAGPFRQSFPDLCFTRNPAAFGRGSDSGRRDAKSVRNRKAHCRIRLFPEIGVCQCRSDESRLRTRILQPRPSRIPNFAHGADSNFCKTLK